MISKAITIGSFETEQVSESFRTRVPVVLSFRIHGAALMTNGTAGRLGGHNCLICQTFYSRLYGIIDNGRDGRIGWQSAMLSVIINRRRHKDET